MCSIIAILLLVVGGLFGYSMVEQSSGLAPTPQISIATVEVAPTLESRPKKARETILTCPTPSSSVSQA